MKKSENKQQSAPNINNETKSGFQLTTKYLQPKRIPNFFLLINLKLC